MNASELIGPTAIGNAHGGRRRAFGWARPDVSGLSALLRLLSLERLDCILCFWMVVLFDAGPLTDQPSTDGDENDEQHNKADHCPKHRGNCEHQRHTVRLPRFVRLASRDSSQGGA
jgi:hypothetical protein